MWPFSRRSPTKPPKKVGVRLTDDETLACARLLDISYSKPKNQDYEADAILWQWVRKTLGDRYISDCAVKIDTDNRAQYTIVFTHETS